MKIRSEDFRLPAGTQVRPGKWPTGVPSVYQSKRDYRQLPAAHLETLSSLQALHCAADGRVVLLIFQGMDAAGRVGAIRKQLVN
jgi:polyphosphate kinase 2 (PPK2 family)